jgi:hypothetical protein
MYFKTTFCDYLWENSFKVAKSYMVDFMSFNKEEEILVLFSNDKVIRICAKTCFLILKDIQKV